jgi:ribonuclease HI
MKIVNITIVGTCTRYNGPGGWACILRYGENASERVGGSKHTTKRQMELQAVIESLQALREPCHILLNSDNENLLNGIPYRPDEWRLAEYAQQFKRIPDRRPDGDLWLKLDLIADRHLIQRQYLTGTFFHPDKARCDELAQTQAKLNVDVPSGPSLNQQDRYDKRTIRQVLDEAMANDYEIEFESPKRADPEPADPSRDMRWLRTFTRNSKAQHKCHV